MARSQPIAFILNRDVFTLMNNAIDSYVASAGVCVKKLDVTLNENKNRLEEIHQELKEKYDAVVRQIEQVEEEIRRIQRYNSQLPEGAVPISTQGLENQIWDLKKQRDIIYRNLMLLESIQTEIKNRMYEYGLCKSDFVELLDKEFPEVKKRLKTIDDIVNDYSSSNLKL